MNIGGKTEIWKHIYQYPENQKEKIQPKSIVLNLDLVLLKFCGISLSHLVNILLKLKILFDDT